MSNQSRVVSARQFQREFLEALETDTLPAFRQRFRSLKSLTIVQPEAITGALATSLELQHTVQAIRIRGGVYTQRTDGDLPRLRLIGDEDHSVQITEGDHSVKKTEWQHEEG